MSNRRTIAVGVLCIAAMMVGLFFALPELEERPAGVVEDAEVGRTQVREAFAAPAIHKGAIPPGIEDLFAEMGETLRDKKGNCGRFFDPERLGVEVDADGSLGRSERASLVKGFRSGLDKLSETLALTIGWDRIEIRNLRWYVEGSDAVVIIRHTSFDEEGGDTSGKMRWWVCLRNGKWLVYDYEDMSGGGRISVTMGSLLKHLMSKKIDSKSIERFRDFAQRFAVARNAILAGDLATGEAFFRQSPPPEFVPKMKSMFYFYRAAALLGLARAPEALEALELAETSDPDLVGIHLLRASANNILGRHEMAIESATKYLAELGPDEGAYFQLGVAYAAQNRFDLASDAYRKGLDEMPNSPDNIDPFRKTLDAAHKKEVGDRFAKLSKPKKHFDTLYYAAINDNDEAGAWEMTMAYRKIAPNDPQIRVREGRLLMLKGQVAEAGKCFLELLAMPAVKSELLEGDLLSQCMSNCAIELDEVVVYQFFAKFDARRTFRISIARSLDDETAGGPYDGRDAVPIPVQIDRIAAAHRVREPNDPWLFFAIGSAHANAREFDLAERAFAEAAVRSKDEPDRAKALAQRVRALCEMGRGLEAYESIDPTSTTFEQVALYLSYPPRIEELLRLIALRRKTVPETAELHYWEGQAAWMVKDYRRAAIEYRRATKIDGPKYTALVHYRLIRSLIRSKQFDQARKEIETAKAEYYAMDLERAILAAHEGSVKKLVEELDRFSEKREDNYTIHYDEDLGPLLREKPEFAHLLERYPIPQGFVVPGKEE